MLKSNVFPIGRVFGPVTEGEAETLVEYILDDDKFRLALKHMLQGLTEPREFAFDAQALADAYYEHFWGPDAKANREADDLEGA